MKVWDAKKPVLLSAAAEVFPHLNNCWCGANQTVLRHTDPDATELKIIVKIQS